ncbi:Putative cyclopropane/cyclopropene fatty acid synthesis protein [Pseudooceanicola batsensis HTCC2597]|uniref:Putative cyclopropane/cyclopropene fatty acid synthesis protein n=1 Tax=Pseudooceanicola batsensis (strain ATCC BAA-863 / DSM 15984 / KCTC 12145 / HTCC2597) TaxID=252305 RepID=A3TYG6_PSEBH|nr:DUF1365 domain-containing protein [Pseudooceanicola batsensis]EAQ03200.1 Putative cyclopropane/cyclopropene fatty acid synthesis protein [Pseudooceanicola batsensis HTCC2597]
MIDPAQPLLLRGHTWHGRKGAVRNAFRYGVDYVLIDAEAPLRTPRLFGRNRRALAAIHDRDHGGAPGRGRGAAWVREVLRERGLPQPARLRLLAQPRLLGHVFNPVSFWLCEDDRGRLFCVVAEVTNTFGDRHSYLCHHDDLAAIDGDLPLAADKVMHVSPFQPRTGGYRFRFDIRDDHVGIRIDYGPAGEGVIATLTGPFVPLTTARLLGATLRRPLGSLRVLALIHWQAFKLWWKGAAYRPRPEPPRHEVSR